MRDTFKAKVFVETGTGQAETAVWASANFERVFTVEAHEPLHQKAVETFGVQEHPISQRRQPHSHQISDKFAHRACDLWLDAHWCGENTFGKSDECPVVGNWNC